MPEYWVVDLEQGKTWRFSAPGAAGYAEAWEARFGARLESVTLPGLTVDTAGRD